MSMSSQYVSYQVSVYTQKVPKLWSETVEAHRHQVRHAILETTADLVTEKGLRSVTMSEIAEKTGIGRATLYKYFPDVEAILLAWHQRHIQSHLQHLAEVREHAEDPGERLEKVLEAFALHAHESRAHRESELARLVHRGEHMAEAQEHLTDFIEGLLADAAKAGHIRNDVAPSELADYSIYALTAAHTMPTKAAVHRLVAITLDALQPRS